MKRLQVRYSMLTVIWVSVGIILFSVLWALVRGKSAATGGIAGVGSLLFVVSGALFAGEVNTAIKAVNFRVDDRVRHGTDQDRRLAGIERELGIVPDCDPDHAPRRTGLS